MLCVCPTCASHADRKRSEVVYVKLVRTEPMRAEQGEMHAGSDLAFYHMSLSLGPAHLNTHTQIHRSWLKCVPLASLSVRMFQY